MEEGADFRLCEAGVKRDGGEEIIVKKGTRKHTLLWISSEDGSNDCKKVHTGKCE